MKRPPRLLGADDLEDVLGGKRLEIEAVGSVVVGRDRLRIAVDHDRFVAGIGEREAGVAAAVVELDALADAVGAAAEDDHLLRRARLRLVGEAAGEGQLVGRVEVGGRRGELGGAGVDPLEHGMDFEARPQRRDGRLVGSGEGRQARVGKALRLQATERTRPVGQAAGAHLGFRFHDCPQLPQEPRIDLGDVVDLLDRHAEPEGLRAAQEPVRRRAPEGGADGVLVVALAEAGDGHLVEAGEPGLEAAQRLLQRLGEGAADRHDFADRLHRGGQDRLGPGKLLEGEARYLGDDIVDGRLERGRCRAAGDVVVELVEGVADGELGGDLRDRKAGRLRGERRGARDARVHLDHHQAPVGRVDGELHVRPAGLDPDLAQDRDGRVAHQLQFLVGQRQGRGDGDRIAGVDAHRVDVLDRADDDAVVVAVADDLHLELLPAEHQFLDQHLAGRRGVDAALDDLQELLAVVGDAATGAAEGEGRPDDRRQPDDLQRLQRVDQRMGELGARRLEADPLHRLAEELAVLGLVDRFGGGADHLDAVLLEDAHLAQRQGAVQRRLAAHGRQQHELVVRPRGALLLDDLGDDLRA